MNGRSARQLLRSGALVAAVGVTALVLATLLAQRSLPEALTPPTDSGGVAVLDRHGEPLQLVFDGGWNQMQQLPLTQMPPLLAQAVISAEDRRFREHSGIDWRARAAAVAQNLKARRAVRGASTISEQVVRLLHPRPRTLWSRWVEGFEAMRLEARFSKDAILEFYLNQAPYGANRRGVIQAAQYYFGRSLETLSRRETLALAVLLRAPSRLLNETAALQRGIDQLAGVMTAAGQRPTSDADDEPLRFARARPALQAAHFVAQVRARSAGAANGSALHSSLDARLQADAESYLTARLQDLDGEGARQGAALVVDLDGNRIRAWAVVDTRAPDVVGIDAVDVARQPGSTLKPLLYAAAFEKGWGPQTMIDDSALAERINGGLHEYRNYSRTHYGVISVREALGNSLNIPAVKALQFVGAAPFLDKLKALGVRSLDRHPDVYGDGLALGNGEVSLYELVQAYTALAREGRYRPLTVFDDDRESRTDRVGFDAQAARAVSGILADPSARLLEFGDGGVLRFPQSTAVKTGTSSDYRDAWTVAYNGRYVVGVWIGDLSGRATDGITGSTGAALLTRGLLARAGGAAPVIAEVAPDRGLEVAAVPAAPEQPALVQPYDGLQLAMDPRIPDELEAFGFELRWQRSPAAVRWYVDDQLDGEGAEPRWSWRLERGAHVLKAVAEAGDGVGIETQAVRFVVR